MIWLGTNFHHRDFGPPDPAGLRSWQSRAIGRETWCKRVPLPWQPPGPRKSFQRQESGRVKEGKWQSCPLEGFLLAPPPPGLQLASLCCCAPPRAQSGACCCCSAVSNGPRLAMPPTPPQASLFCSPGMAWLAVPAVESSSWAPQGNSSSSSRACGTGQLQPAGWATALSQRPAAGRSKCRASRSVHGLSGAAATHPCSLLGAALPPAAEAGARVRRRGGVPNTLAGGGGGRKALARPARTVTFFPRSPPPRRRPLPSSSPHPLTVSFFPSLPVQTFLNFRAIPNSLTWLSSSFSPVG